MDNQELIKDATKDVLKIALESEDNYEAAYAIEARLELLIASLG